MLQPYLLWREHLEQLAPHLVGEQVWAAVEGRTFDTWLDFQSVIKDRWGLTAAQCWGAFYAMRPRPGEAFEAFVARVEDERARL